MKFACCRCLLNCARPCAKHVVHSVLSVRRTRWFKNIIRSAMSYDGWGNWMSHGEWESVYGSIFGHVTVQPGNRPGTLTWDPSDCTECDCEIPFYWNNYNYRCCMGCWNVVYYQLWPFLEYRFHSGPAHIIWAFLLEPCQH